MKDKNSYTQNSMSQSLFTKWWEESKPVYWLDNHPHQIIKSFSPDTFQVRNVTTGEIRTVRKNDLRPYFLPLTMQQDLLEVFRRVRKLIIDIGTEEALANQYDYGQLLARLDKLIAYLQPHESLPIHADQIGVNFHIPPTGITDAEVDINAGIQYTKIDFTNSTANDFGADPIGYADDQIAIHNADPNAHGGSTSTFDGNRTVRRQGIPNINVGTTTTLADFIDAYFFPVAPPNITLSIVGGNNREFGGSNLLTLSWAVTKTGNTIATITIDGTSITATGESQSGSQSATATQNINTTFNASVVDSESLADSASVTLQWQNKRYWGRLPDPITNIPTDADILALDGAGVGSGNELASNFTKTYNGINGAGQHLVFAFPSSFGTPRFFSGVFEVTAMTKVRDNAFVNANGYSIPYQVWATNTAQNSPIDEFRIGN